MGSEDLNGHQDLQEHFKSFSSIVHHYNNINAENINLKRSVERLTADIESVRKSEIILTDHLQIITKTYEKEDSINLLYLKLKEKYAGLEKKCNYLIQQNNSIQNNTLIEVTELEEKFKLEKNKLIEEFTNKLKHSEEQLFEERTSFLKQKNELNNELYAIQVANTHQCHEMQATEKSLQLQLRELVDSRNALRQEYLLFKTNNQSELDTARKKIEDLNKKLRFTEQQLRINQEHLFQLTSETETQHNVHEVKSSAQRCDMLTLNMKNHNLQENNYNSLTITSRSSINKVKPLNVNEATLSSYLPPLKQLSDTGSKQKKRKLYNPGTIDLKNTNEF